MIYVLAFVKTKPGMHARVLDLYRVLVPKIMTIETGCIEYVPTTDLDSFLPNQENDDNMIVVSERWRTLADFESHLGMPHTLEFRVAVLPCLERRITVRVTQPTS